MIRQALVLATGLAPRAAVPPHLPEPLLPLAGRALLDHALDRLAKAGVTRVLVSAIETPALQDIAAQLEQHLAGRPGVTLWRTSQPGAAAAARAAMAAGELEREPLFVVDGESYWLDGPTPALDRLRAAFQPDHTDTVLLVHRTFQVQAEIGRGDFAIDRSDDPWGSPRRPGESEIVPYVSAGVQLASPALFAAEGGRGALWQAAIDAGRLRCVVHDGLWFHLDTAHDLAEAETALRFGLTGDTT